MPRTRFRSGSSVAGQRIIVRLGRSYDLVRFNNGTRDLSMRTMARGRERILFGGRGLRRAGRVGVCVVLALVAASIAAAGATPSTAPTLVVDNSFALDTTDPH